MNGHACRNVSLCHPEGPTVENLPLLLRRVADLIEELDIKPDELLDVTFSNDDLTDDGFRWTAAIYWQTEEDDATNRLAARH